MGTFALTQIAAHKVKAPVIAAGGIVDGRGITAAMTLGAQAAQLGTAFLVCAESGASDTHRDALFGHDARNTRLTRAYTGRLARGIPNRLMDEIEKRIGALPPFPIQAWFLSPLKPAAAEAGRADLTVLYANQAAPRLRHRSVAALMPALVEELG